MSAVEPVPWDDNEDLFIPSECWACGHRHKVEGPGPCYEAECWVYCDATPECPLPYRGASV